MVVGTDLHPRPVPDQHRRASIRPPPPTHSQEVIAAAALVLCTVILSGALVESDRAHRRRSTLDPLTGLFNRNALEQRLAELDGQPCEPRARASPTPCCSATSTTSSGSTTSSATPPATPSCRTSPTRCAPRCAPATRSTASAARRSSSSCPGPTGGDAVEIAERLRQAVRERRPGRGGGDGQHRGRRLRSGAVDTDDLARPRRRGALRGQGRWTGRVVVAGDAAVPGRGPAAISG